MKSKIDSGEFSENEMIGKNSVQRLTQSSDKIAKHIVGIAERIHVHGVLISSIHSRCLV